MSFGRVVHESVEARRRQANESLEQSRQRWRAAAAWVAEHMPETVEPGQPGVHALVLQQALAVRDLAVDGRGPVTPERVRERLRLAHPEAWAELYGNTEQEAA